MNMRWDFDVLRSRLRGILVLICRHGMWRGKLLLRCPLVYSSLWLTGLTLPVWWLVGDPSVWFWAAIMATQLRWSGGYKGLWVALCARAEPCSRP